MTKWVAKLQMTGKEIKPLFSDSLGASRNLPVQTLHIVNTLKVSGLLEVWFDVQLSTILTWLLPIKKSAQIAEVVIMRGALQSHTNGLPVVQPDFLPLTQ